MAEESFRVAVLGGTGALGSGLARAWARAGIAVCIGSRSAEKATMRAKELSDACGSRIDGLPLKEAAEWSTISVLTVPYASHLETIRTCQPGLAGKILVDATVPLKPPKVSRAQLPEAGCAALEAQALLGDDTEVVSAFQNVGADHLTHAGFIDCDVLVAGNRVAAREAAIALAKAAGMRGIHAGPLNNSAATEALTSALIHINRRYDSPGAGIRITSGRPDSRIELLAPTDVPEVAAGDDLAEVLLDALENEMIGLLPGDVVAVAQKVVSKAEGRRMSLAGIEPRAEAVKLAEETDKDPRLVELILRESNEVVRAAPGVLVVEHRTGIVLANAGIDQSNVGPEGDGQAMLLPQDPDGSARALSDRFSTAAGGLVGVIVTDSIGRAWRLGTVGHAIGIAGLSGLTDLRGTQDRDERTMQVTEVGLGDEIAAAASLLMGQASEGRPAVVIRGLGWNTGDDGAAALLRTRERDLFR